MKMGKILKLAKAESYRKNRDFYHKRDKEFAKKLLKELEKKSNLTSK